MVLFSQTRTPGFPRIFPKFDLYTVGVGTDQVCQVSSHTYTTFWGFQPMRKAGTGFRKLSELFGNHFLGDEVESLACMGIAMITIHTNTLALYICVCVCLCSAALLEKKLLKLRLSIDELKKVLWGDFSLFYLRSWFSCSEECLPKKQSVAAHQSQQGEI